MFDLHRNAVHKRIGRWQAAGLIDGELAERLLAFETTGRRDGVPITTAIGGLSIALGIMAMVGANWDEIPVWLKLGVHIAINLGLGFGVWWSFTRESQHPVLREVLVTVLAASTTALVAHIGQSYQLQGSEFRFALACLVLVTPFVIAASESAANRWMWLAAVFATFSSGMIEHIQWLEKQHMIVTTVAAFGCAGYATPLLARLSRRFEPFGRDLNLIMLTGLVVATSAAQIAWRFEISLSDLDFYREVVNGVGVATVGLAVTHLAMTRDWAAEKWRVAFVVLSPLYAGLPVFTGGADSAIVAGFAFCLYWAAISQIAYAGGMNGLYRLSVVVIAIRLYVAFLEAFGGLLMTGVGLIVTGLSLLAFGWLVKRVLAARPVERSLP